jgi:HTH-type transcriptional regulator/antitoxin MqsA
MTEQLKCSVCDTGNLALEEGKRSVEIDGIAVEIPFFSHACEQCGTVQGTDEDLRLNARAMRKAVKVQRKLLSGEEVRAHRKHLCLTQEQAAVLFGGGPVAFSKYENDEVSQSESMDRLIWLAAKFPWIVAVLAERFGVALSSQATLVVEWSHTTYQSGYLAQAIARVRNARVAFEGFAEGSSANDDEPYRPTHGARTTLKLAA